MRSKIGLNVYYLLFSCLLSFDGRAFAAINSKGAKNSENTIPMHFDVLGDGVDLTPVELEYDLSSEAALKMGGIELSDKTVVARLIPVKKMGTRLAQSLPGSEQRDLYLLFNWPQSLISNGNLEVISRSGRVLASYSIDEKGSLWRATLDRWKQHARKGGLKKDVIDSAPLFKIGFGALIDVKAINPIFFVGMESFRFCITRQSENNGLSRICTPGYQVISKDESLGLELVPRAASPARVIIQREKAALQNSMDVSKEQQLQFFAETSSGLSYEFVSEPSALNIIEMTAEPGKESGKLISYGLRPLQAYRDLARKEEDFLDRFGFKQTIGDLREFWETSILLSTPTLYMPCPGGGVFKHTLKIKRLPSESIRPYMELRTTEGSYIDGVKIFGRAASGTQLQSKQNSVEVSKKSREFVWKFRAKNRGEVNKSYLLVKSGDQEFRAYHEVYKGYPRELSARLSGIISSEGKLVPMGEFAFNYWFEDLFGWTNYYIGRQRWGVSAKYFQSLMDFSLKNTSSSAANSGPLTISTVDLKYRLKPGLWNRDESWGLCASYQQVSFLTFIPKFVGGGVFWARSMPKVFDDIFNLLSIFRYPKWVDAEYIMYFMPADSITTVNSLNYALNFHGKVMWTNSFFGEAGFGLKQYGFQDNESGRKLAFASLYGTVGLGYSF